MNACRTVRKWITKNVLVPVQRAITDSREECHEVGRWVEEHVTKPVERFISKVEQFCHDLPWPLDWFCEAVTVVVKVIEWVVETVVKWVVTVVCQVVTFVVGLVIELVLRVIGWVVQFVVCIFTDPIEALKSIYDLWHIVLDVVDDVFDFVGLLLDDVVGILDDVERLIDSVAASLGWLGVILGLIKGIIGLIRRIVEIVRDAVKAIQDVILGILDLNPCRMLRGLTDLGTAVGRALIEALFPLIGFAVGGPIGALVGGAIKVIGAIVGGVRDSVQLKHLEDVIEEKIRSAFGSDQARIDRSLEKVNFDSRIVGLPFAADARRMFLSSTTERPNLRELHRAGVLDLRSLAGYVAGCDRLINEADAEVVYAGTDLRVSYVDIDAYLDEGPDAVPEFHVFPITRAKFTDYLEIGRKKARFLGVQLTYPSLGSFQIVKPEWIPLQAGESKRVSPTDGTLNNVVQQTIFRDFFGRNALVTDDLSTLPALEHFHYVDTGKELFGLTSWFRPSLDPPATGDISERQPSGVTARNRTPSWVFRWVLIHEMGHYWGLDHLKNQRGPDEIMFTLSDGTVTSSMFYEFLLLGGEPRFTFEDIRTVWTWITGDARDSLLP
jgi:hypothetical protein